MEEDIENIERVIDYIQLESPIIQGIGNAIYTDSLKKLLKQYKELEEENATLKKVNNIAEDVTVEDITQVMNKSLEEFKREFIPISVIQNTLDDINKNIEEFTRNVVTTKEEIEQEYWKSESNKAIAKRNVLKEILEKGNK